MHGQLTISIRDKKEGRYYRAWVTTNLARRHDNGALISCGWTVDESLPRATLERMRRQGRLTEVSESAWKHSSCLSACTERGAKACRW